MKTIGKKLVAALDALQSSGITVGQRYRHYRTQTIYQIVGAGVFEETLEPLIYYAEPTDTWAWARTLKEFTADVEWGLVTVKRFSLIE